MALQDLIDRVAVMPFVYWQADKPGGFGDTTFKKPVELLCRWEDVAQEIVSPDGRTRLSNAHLIVQGVQLVVASVVMLGTLADWKKMPTYPKIPTNAQGGYEVIKSGHTPNFDGEDLLYEAWL